MAANQMQGITGSIWSKYRQKKRHSRDGGGKQMRRRSVFATVTDMSGGVPQGPGLLPQTKVPVPRTRREKYLLGVPAR